MHAQKKQSKWVSGCIIASVALLSSCGSGSGDQTSVPEVGQATQEPLPTTVTVVPVTPESTDAFIPAPAPSTDSIAPKPTIAPEAEPELIAEVVPEAEPEPLPETPVDPDSAPETDIDPTDTPLPETPVEPTIAPTIPETQNPEPLVNVGCTASQADIQTSTLQLINDARAEERMCGEDLYGATTPLTWNTKLQDAALAHSLDMTTHNFFGHVGSDGSVPSDRVDAQRYDWQSVGENVAAGQPTTELVVQAWLDSPGHCANLMNPKFKETAVVCVEDSGAQYRHYWTNVLGTSF